MIKITMSTPAGQDQDITEYVAALQDVAKAVETLEHYWYVTGTSSTKEQAEADMIAAMERLRRAENQHGSVSSIDGLKAMVAARCTTA